jgi:hypothetical protein
MPKKSGETNQSAIICTMWDPSTSATQAMGKKAGKYRNFTRLRRYEAMEARSMLCQYTKQSATICTMCHPSASNSCDGQEDEPGFWNKSHGKLNNKTKKTEVNKQN